MTQQTEEPKQEMTSEELWAFVFSQGHPALRELQTRNKEKQSPPRCKLCFAPFRGPGAEEMKREGREPSNRNPRYCSMCDQWIRANPGGADVLMTILFLDVSGSTRLGEELSNTDFAAAMRSFYRYTFPLINETDGFITEVRGDGVLAVYPPGFSGEDHARKALDAVRQLLGARIAAPNGSELVFSIGAHTGRVYIGTMTGTKDQLKEGEPSEGIEDVTVLGDAANVAAKLCDACKPGEALVSDALWTAAKQSGAAAADRVQVQVKGKKAPVSAHVLRH